MYGVKLYKMSFLKVPETIEIGASYPRIFRSKDADMYFYLYDYFSLEIDTI